MKKNAVATIIDNNIVSTTIILTILWHFSFIVATTMFRGSSTRFQSETYNFVLKHFSLVLFEPIYMDRL